jgi:RimJ/RimL family protein N-acetyltransferase
MYTGKERKLIVDKILPVIKFGNLVQLVNEEDADFIFSLRTDPELSKFLSEVKGTEEDQLLWIKGYKTRELLGDEFYFITLDPTTGQKQGLNRISNLRGDTFELGSWIYKSNLDISVSILGDIAVREIAFDTLGFSVCTFNVRKANKSVLKYHKSYSPEMIAEDNYNYYFKLTHNVFNTNKMKYLEICGYGKY